MYKKIINVFLLLSIGVCAFAQEQQTLLWEISGNGLTKTSYIFGTIHVICPTDFQLSDSTKKAFGKTEQVYLELDMDDPNTMAAIQNEMVMADGKTAKDFLNEEEYKLLENYVKTNFGLDMKVFGQMKPIALTAMMYIALLRCQPKSYENELVSMASTDKKEVFGLETVREQMGFFNAIPYKTQYKELVKNLKDSDNARMELKKMIDTYLSNDLVKLNQVMLSSDWGGFKGFENTLLYDRNQRWISQMTKTMKDKPTFFAVGAGHLGGEKGVVALLKKQGYKLRAIKW